MLNTKHVKNRLTLRELSYNRKLDKKTQKKNRGTPDRAFLF